MLYNLSPFASDQLKETTSQINRLLTDKSISPEAAKRLIDAARFTEGISRYFGFPLENASAQTPELEARRIELMSRR